MDAADFLRVSAFDLATISGVAYGTGASAPVTERWDLGIAGRGLGDRGLQLMRKLHRHLDEYEPQVVYIERALPPAVLAQIGSTPETSEFLVGSIFLARTVFRSRKIETIQADRQDVLKHFVGQRRFKVKGQAKKAVQVRCRQLGWEYQDDNAADACALWDYGVSTINPRAFMLAASRRPIARISA